MFRQRPTIRCVEKLTSNSPIWVSRQLRNITRPVRTYQVRVVGRHGWTIGHKSLLSRTRLRSATCWSTTCLGMGSGFTASRGGEALRRLVDRGLPSLVMLDIGLPGEDGFALARWLRERSGRVGIIMVTAATDTVDRVVGLETGADDYIAKPFEPRELLARVKSVLRRTVGSGPASGAVLRVRMGRRVLDLERRVLCTPGEASEDKLSASEFDLLKVFAENPNRPLMRDWLLEVTAHRDLEAFDRSIDLRITRLRRKIEVDPTHPEAIRTVRGVGYMFVPSKDSAGRGLAAPGNELIATPVHFSQYCSVTVVEGSWGRRRPERKRLQMMNLT